MKLPALPTTGLAIGLTASVAANVDHELIQPTIDVAGIVFGVVVAGAVLVSFELLIKPSRKRTVIDRVFRYVGGGVVFVSAGVTSYLHLNDVLNHAHEPKLIQIIGPAVIDGLMILSGWVRSASRSTVVLPADNRADKSPRDEIRGRRLAAAGLTTPPVGDRVTKGVSALSGAHTASQSVSVSPTPRQGVSDVRSVQLTADLVAAARPVYRAMVKDGQTVTVRGFDRALRANGVNVGNRKVTALIELFKFEKVGSNG